MIMKIVGFQSGHDVSYTILENGVPVIHEELERYIREKEPLGDGLKFFFEQNPNMRDIDYFAFGNPGGRSGKWKKTCGNQESEDKMLKIIDENEGKFYEMGHHQSHAANAFFSSNFDEALIVTLDGGGTELKHGSTAFTVWTGEDNKLSLVEVIPASTLNIGDMWNKILRGCGFSTGHPLGNQAGTLMAMATVPETETNEDKFIKARALQKETEQKVREYLTPYIEAYDGENLCLSGGVSLNSVMLGKFYEWFSKIKNIFCDPIPYDGGLSLGAARYVWHHVLDNPRIQWKDNSSPYLGRTYDLESIDKALKTNEEKIFTGKVTNDDVVELLAKDNNVISVFGGGSESGRRALGNRSILADPRSPDMKDIINEKVKHRQWFRPFAPSIIREEVKNWFVKDIDSPYMSFVLKWKEEVKDKVPAVVHLDGTARLQTVTNSDNNWYYNFIKKFGEKTGVPILLNTSFNDREPIVETPEHAINCFLVTNIDYLYFYDFGILVSKKK